MPVLWLRDGCPLFPTRLFVICEFLERQSRIKGSCAIYRSTTDLWNIFVQQKIISILGQIFKTTELDVVMENKEKGKKEMKEKTVYLCKCLEVTKNVFYLDFICKLFLILSG
jgi:hypothetical protein